MYSEEVVKTLNEDFVPYAMGWYINRDDPVVLEAVERAYHQKQRPDEGTGNLGGAGYYLMTSTGHLLGNDLKRSRDPAGVQAALEKILAEYEALPREQRVAQSVDGEIRPQPAPPAGGLVLTVYERPLGRSADGTYRRAETGDMHGNMLTVFHNPLEDVADDVKARAAAESRIVHARDGGRDTLWLNKAECDSLIPDSPKLGATFPVDEKLAKRIWLYSVIPHSMVLDRWEPDSLKRSELHISVANVSARTIRLRIHGDALLILHDKINKQKHRDLINSYDARLEGEIEYDREQQRIVRWDMATLGNYTGHWHAPAGRSFQAMPNEPIAVGFAFELNEEVYQLPPERRHPCSYMHAHVFNGEREKPFYWDPDLWLESWKEGNR